MSPYTNINPAKATNVTVNTTQAIASETVLLEPATIEQTPIPSTMPKLIISSYDKIMDLVKDNYQVQQFDDKEIRNIFYTLYSTVKQIGKGGFGIIFSGYRIKDNLPIAIKVIKKTKITQWFNLEGRRIPLEIALMFRVTQVKSCIKILDYMEQPNYFVIVMERQETCRDLFDYITEYGSVLDELKVKLFFKQIVQTICDCYKLGVLHRDIKDENILIDMKTGQLKLIDFGAGTFFTNKNCLFNDFQGTRVYSPPEWITRQCYYGDRAAVWSLGVLLYNLVYGDIPWEEDNDIVACRLNARRHFVHYQPSKELENLILQCLDINDETRIDLHDILKHKWFSSQTTTPQPQVPLTIQQQDLSLHTPDTLYTIDKLEMNMADDVLKFEPLGSIGEGTFGTVKKARYRNEIVAVKIFNKSENQDLNFNKELQQLKRLTHDNIIKIITHGKYIDNNQIHYAIVMEYADFGSLHKMLHDEKHLNYTLGHAINWLYQISCAVDYLHSAKPKPITHRDLKPLNILLAKGGTLVKLCDFGTACDVHTLMTSEKGTYVYMAPEVLKGTDYKAKYDETCDVYSYGIVMWEIFTRKRPFFDKPNLRSYQIILQKAQHDLKPTYISKLPNILQLLYECSVSGNVNKRPKMSFINELMTTLNKIVNKHPITRIKPIEEFESVGYLSPMSITRFAGSPYISSEYLSQKSSYSSTIQQTQHFLNNDSTDVSFVRDNLKRLSFHESKTNAEFPTKKRNQNTHKRSQSYGDPSALSQIIMKKDSMDSIVQQATAEPVEHEQVTVVVDCNSEQKPEIEDILLTPLEPISDHPISLKYYREHCLLLREDQDLKIKIDQLNKQKEQLLKVIRDQDLYQSLLKQKNLLKHGLSNLEAQLTQSSSHYANT